MEVQNVVSPAEWRAALDDIRTQKKMETRRRDAPAHPAEVVR